MRAVPLLLSSALTLMILGCGQTEPPPPSVSSSTERGPYAFTATATPPTVPFGDPITLELSAQTPADTRIAFTEPNEPNTFSITQLDGPQKTPTGDGRVAWSATYELYPLDSGDLALPPATMEYADEPNDPNAALSFAQTLTTEPLTITVESLLSEDDSLDSPRDITGVVLPPEPLSYRDMIWTGLIAGAVAAALVAAMIVWRRRAQQPPPPIPADVWALQQLRELADANLDAADHQREFYYRLSEIVRGYIERQFAIAAPDMTTPEFLSALLRDPGPLAGSEDRLRTLLETCDAVKYAAFDPGHAASEQALTQARAFVADSAAAAQRLVGGQAA